MDSKMSKKVAGFFAKKGNKKLAAHERREAAGKEKDTPAIAKQEMKALKGAPAAMKNYEKKEHKSMGMACGGMTKKYAAGGAVRRPPAGDKYAAARNDFRAGEMEAQREADMIAANAPTRGTGRGPLSRNGMMPRTKMYAKGGMVKGDGCASKGKTKGRFI